MVLGVDCKNGGVVVLGVGWKKFELVVLGTVDETYGL